MYDWRTFPEQFAKSRDLDEKALYKLLKEEVGPTIIEALIIRAQEKAKEEAVMNRKRSSRIATIQLEREEIVRRETAQREMEERMEKTQKEESRKDREEAELARREKARDERLKEREERAQAREEAILAKAREEQDRLDRAERERQERARRREEGLPHERSVSAADPGDISQDQDQAEGWELNCEVCKKTGWNLVSPLSPRRQSHSYHRMTMRIPSRARIAVAGSTRDVMTCRTCGKAGESENGRRSTLG